MRNRGKLLNHAVNVLLLVSVAESIFLQYTGENALTLVCLCAIMLGYLFISFRKRDVWTDFRKNLSCDVVFLAAVTAMTFALYFFNNMRYYEKTLAAAQSLNISGEKLAGILAVSGGILALFSLCLLYGQCNRVGEKVQHISIDQRFTHDAAIQIKGFLIIIMVVHHAFGFPEWYADGIAYPWAAAHQHMILGSTKICTGVFAVITGYTYALHKDKSFSYSWRKIISILKPYTIIWLFALLLSVTLCGYTPSVISLVLEYLMLGNQLLIFGWYVHFYIVSMLLLPLAVKVSQKRYSPIFEMICFMTIWVGTVFLTRIFSQNPAIQFYGGNWIFYFPCITVGYFMGKYKVIDGCTVFIQEKLPHYTHACLGVLLIATSLYLRVKVSEVYYLIASVNLDIFYAPILIIGFLLLLDRIPVVSKILRILGQYSLDIWLLHSIFFAGATKQVFQPIAYAPKNPVLVVSWILALCLCSGILLRRVAQRLEKLFRKNKLVLKK